MALVKDNLDKLPPEGASQAIVLGAGKDARLGAMGRVPGPAGRGPDGAIFAVLSGTPLSAKHRGPMTFARLAMDRGDLTEAPLPLIAGLLLVALGLAWWLPQQEIVGPLRRLTAEFKGLSEGSQHQIFHTQYGGAVADLAMQAAAVEAIRINIINKPRRQTGRRSSQDAINAEPAGHRSTDPQATRSRDGQPGGSLGTRDPARGPAGARHRGALGRHAHDHDLLVRGGALRGLCPRTR